MVGLPPMRPPSLGWELDFMLKGQLADADEILLNRLHQQANCSPVEDTHSICNRQGSDYISLISLDVYRKLSRHVINGGLEDFQRNCA
jgi:hypothetical protein